MPNTSHRADACSRVEESAHRQKWGGVVGGGAFFIYSRVGWRWGASVRDRGIRSGCTRRALLIPTISIGYAKIRKGGSGKTDSKN